MNQIEHAEVVAFVGKSKLAAETFHGDVADDEVGLRRSAIGNDGALYVWNDCLDVWLIKAKNCRAVERDAIYEFNENRLNLFKRVVLVEMFAVDRRDDGNDWSVVEEAAVAFVGFNNKVF